jgi:glycosyltransferase involved in cell wall biosynthesis
MAVFNGERFVAQALTSALTQDYPPELLDVVVVDDGSTDATASIVAAIAAEHPGRVQLIRQPNAGNCAATNAAIAAARGELLAVIDADDVWPRAKTRRQVALLQRRPEVGLVYGDMTVIDEVGNVVQESWLANDVTPEGLGAGGLLAGNNVTGSSIMLRADVAREITPMPVDLPYADWYFAVCVAERRPIAYLPRPRTFYRLHDDNTCLGTQGPRRERELRKALRFQRWCLRRMQPGGATVRELADAWTAFERNAREVQELAGPFTAIFALDAADRTAARSGARRGLAELRRGDPHVALFHLVAAAAADPFDAQAREGLEVALVTLEPALGEDGQDPLRDAQPFVIAVDADEALARPELLRTLAGALDRVTGVSVVIDASEWDAATAAQRLGRLVDETGSDHLDLIALTGVLTPLGRARLAAGTSAVLGRRALPGHRSPRLDTDRQRTPDALVADVVGGALPVWLPVRAA